MQLYELSQSSFYVAEAAHLIELAAAVGRSEETAHLVTRQQSMKKMIAETMWDNDAQVFANRYPDDAPNGETKGIGGFSQKISPTSFYPLLANASTVRFNCFHYSSGAVNELGKSCGRTRKQWQ